MNQPLPQVTYLGVQVRDVPAFKAAMKADPDVESIECVAWPYTINCEWLLWFSIRKKARSESEHNQALVSKEIAGIYAPKPPGWQ